MFELIHHFVHMQQLYGTSEIEFGAQDISNMSDASGNEGADWNYGYLFLNPDQPHVCRSGIALFWSADI